MQPEGQKRRRIIGAVLVGAAVLMLIFGEFLLQGRRDLVFIAYWMVCMVLTVLAMVAAVKEVRALRQSSRQEQIELIEGSFKEIVEKARRHKQIDGNRPKDTLDEN